MSVHQLTFTIDDLDFVASSLLDKVTTKTLLFYGEMGVGKTTLIKALTSKLGSDTHGHSPTFSIVNEYEIKNDFIYHFDLYRIKDENETLNFGIEEYLYSEHWIFVEWPEKLGSLTPDNYDYIDIALNLDGSRTLKLTTINNLTKEKPKMY